MTRPEPPSAPDGWYREPVPAAGWRVATDEERGRLCRGTRPTCKQPVIAALWRPSYRYATGEFHGAWWFYCADHFYGHWIEHGTVMSWRLARSPNLDLCDQ